MKPHIVIRWFQVLRSVPPYLIGEQGQCLLHCFYRRIFAASCRLCSESGCTMIAFKSLAFASFSFRLLSCRQFIVLRHYRCCEFCLYDCMIMVVFVEFSFCPSQSLLFVLAGLLPKISLLVSNIVSVNNGFCFRTLTLFGWKCPILFRFYKEILYVQTLLLHKVKFSECAIPDAFAELR